MGVVRVRHMGMPMLLRLMPVRMAVFACRHGIVHVVVMPVAPMTNKASTAPAEGKGSPERTASSEVAVVPSSDLHITTCPESRLANATEPTTAPNPPSPAAAADRRAASGGGLALNALTRQQADGRGTGIEQRRRIERTEADADLLHQRRADAKQRGGQQGRLSL